MATPEFYDEWNVVVGRIEAYLARLLKDRNDVDDVLQQTMIRACRGFATFQGRSTFLTWTLRIAHHEALRFLDRRRVHQPLTETASPPTDSATASTPDWTHAIAGAVQDRFLTDQQATILRERLASGESSWTALAAKLELQPNHCAVLHHRAVRDLRVYLFLARPEILGDRAELEEAFRSAQAQVRDALTDQEAGAFRRAVVERSTGSARGLLGPLRSACEKVARHLRRA